MLSIVFAKYITREFNSDVAGNTLHTDDKLREHMYSYGTGRERTEYADLNDLSKCITDQIGFDRLRSARSISIYRLES